MDKVGKDGVITVEEGQEPGDHLDWSRACSSTAATSRPYFVTDPERMEASSRTPTS
jgi:chaperonin GroEL